MNAIFETPDTLHLWGSLAIALIMLGTGYFGGFLDGYAKRCRDERKIGNASED